MADQTLSDALLLAQTSYRQALETHERQGTELTRRALLEARGRLEYLEQRLYADQREQSAALPLSCPTCGGEPVAEHWSAFDRPITQTTKDGRTVRLVPPLPDWALDFAVQGIAFATRFTCRNCGEEITRASREWD